MQFDFFNYIPQRAGLFLDTESTATKARKKVEELKDVKNKLEMETQRQMELAENDSVTIQSNENLQGTSKVAPFPSVTTLEQQPLTGPAMGRTV
jgi:hypothetical protein